MEAEMISGQAEAQLLQILLKLSGGKDVLDIGTMAEATPPCRHGQGQLAWLSSC